jgi:hypothetical protein
MFQKIRGDICKSRFATGGKFATGVNNTGGNLPPVSMTPAANLPPVSTTLGKLVAKFAAGVIDTGGVDTGGKLLPVSTTPVTICHQYQQHRRQICHR